jgi:VanZ family protein
MPAQEPQSKLWIATVIMAAVILYGSYYPFDFAIPAHGEGPIATFIASAARRPGRGDFIANILLYLPFGFFFVQGLASSRRTACVPLAVLCGAGMSLFVELTQYYDPGRVTSFSDFCTNTLGTLLGGLAALAIGAKFRLPFVGDVTTQPIPTLLISRRRRAKVWWGWCCAATSLCCGWSRSTSWFIRTHSAGSRFLA